MQSNSALLSLMKAIDPHRYDIPFSELVRDASLVDPTAPPESEIIQENVATFRIQGVDRDPERATIKARAIRNAFLPRWQQYVRGLKDAQNRPLWMPGVDVPVEEQEAMLTEMYADRGLVMCLIRIRLQ